MRHWQVTLRSLQILLVLTALTAGALWWLTDQPRRRAKAIATAKRALGVVQLDDEHNPELPAPKPAKIDATGWLDEHVGPHLAHRLSVVNLDGSRVSDDDLKHFEGIKSLRRLYLNGTSITAAGMTHLRGLPNLEILELRETGLGDSGLAHLEDLSSLRSLYLSETRVGDAGLTHVALLPNLEELSLWNTSVGDRGLSHVGKLTSIKALKLGRTRITDAGLAHLTGLKNLEFLDLSNTAITDNGLTQLEGLSELRLLLVDGTKVTRAGMAAMRQAIPALQVYR